MKKILVVIASVCITLSSLQAQKKYEKIMYKDVTVESDGISLVGKDGVSNKEMTKFKIKITNKTDDIIVFKPDESTLKANSKEFKPKEKTMEVPPTETDGKVINFTGPEFMVNSYSYLMEGIYKVSTLTNSVQTEDFVLPPSQNEFKTGNFTCTMSDLNKETDKTKVKFECRYTGNKVGVIHPGRAAVKLPDGTEVANAKSSQAPIIVEKGESKKFTMYWNRMEGGRKTDMQLIKLLIIWRNTFVEADMVKLKPVTLDFQIDEALSK
ncbi:hypothetical protein CNR22_21445 [Sphingobacteriaceae bacterium]|nr:hypothetical protein CNR22_21445 [Sphingobacteriaceae bacterium]